MQFLKINKKNLKQDLKQETYSGSHAASEGKQKQQVPAEKKDIQNKVITKTLHFSV